jgi:dipeptidyl aminopeptidase/acylaminoacyl peptidase
MQPVLIPARDGLQLPGYLTLPPNSPPAAQSPKLPLVLMVHGGPWARDDWGFDPYAQWLANRGYAVLQVNYRGSTGFGKAFLNAGNGQWGVGAMQHDLTDAVHWAVAQGIADPKRVCIFGGSYGGYATLAGLAFTPDLYACGVDIVGPSQIKTLFESIPPYWAPAKKEMVLRVGDVEHDAALNRRISPLFHVDDIRAPLMVLQGANDPRVKIAESNQIVSAMREKGLPVTYIVFPDEGHGFARPDNSLDANAHIEQFLAKYLGGRAEPIKPIEGSTAEIR